MRTRLLMAVIVMILTVITCHASWLIYHKPEFKGKIVDLETHEPIERAVVVVIYRIATYGPGDTVISDLHAQEALTDKNGEFRIPPYTTFIEPLSTSDVAEFIIFKPGYICNGPSLLEDEFSGDGKRDWVSSAKWDNKIKYRILKSGIVMSPKIVTGRDRIESFRNVSISRFEKELPLASKIIRDEHTIVMNLTCIGE